MPPAPVLLIGWSAADWKLLHPIVDAGEMPHLAALLARGVMGTLTAPLPLVDALLCTSLATGMRAHRHGILGNPDDRSPISLRDRRCPAVWDLLRDQGLSTHLVNWPLSDPAEMTGGVCVADKFFELSLKKKSAEAERLIQPPDLAPALAKLRVNPDEVDDETLRFFIPELNRASREYDERLPRLARAIARTLSIHAVTMWLLENSPAQVTAVRFSLLAELASWALPLAAPKLDAVSQLEFDLYQHLLAGACRTLDLLLGPLLKLAGIDATVFLVSDHGLLLDAARPGLSMHDFQRADSWRRREGIVVISGPACRQDEVMFGANLLDIAPTVLAFLGLPVPSEIEGRVLTEAFRTPPAFLPAPQVPSPHEIQTPFVLSEKGSEEAITRQWNLARSHLDGQEVKIALTLIEDLHRVRPDRLDFLQALFDCQLALRQLDQARETLEHLLDRVWSTPQARLLQARLEYVARRFDQSLQHLEAIEPNYRPRPGVNLQIGLNLVKLNQNDRARECFAREIKIRPECAEAWAGMAYCSLREGKLDQTIEQSLKAVAFNFQMFYAHFFLGLAQAKQERIDQALVALKLVTQLAPQFAAAHRCLAVLYAQQPGNEELAQCHKKLAKSSRIRGWGF